MAKKYKILAINPGSTSTKVALYLDTKPVFSCNLEHAADELKKYESIASQKEFRAQQIEAELKKEGAGLADLSAIVARGGLLKPLESGTYKVGPDMLQDLTRAERGEHASNLGAMLAWDLGQPHKLPCYIVDPVSVDELQEVARLSGFAPLERISLSHALNMKAVAKRYATEVGQKYEQLKLVVAHLGSGISISAHLGGRMIDVANPREEGPFSTERAGSLPVLSLIKYVLQEGHDYKTMDRLLFREGGLYSYLGTKDLRKVRQMIADGHQTAGLVLQAMIYQIAKGIGGMLTVLAAPPDAILLTGGLLHDTELAADVERRISFLTREVRHYPGEDELQALTEGALRVLRQEETAKIY